MLAPIVGKEIGKCNWCGVVFGGSMSEVPHIQARSILVNDLHEDIINLATVVADKESCDWLISEADRRLFHPKELRRAQEHCKNYHVEMSSKYRAVAYFVAVWMGRSAMAGTDGEFDGNLSARFTASGGGSNVRYRSAIESLAAWHQVCKRCEFTCLDFREFLKKCHDRKGHALYSDAPFPDAGEDYLHKFTQQDHRDLAIRLSAFREARVVCRFYDHPLIRELYPEGRWRWTRLNGRDQANNGTKQEVLITGASP
jgi:DNA adenine methylase